VRWLPRREELKECRVEMELENKIHVPGNVMSGLESKTRRWMQVAVGRSKIDI
jgi:hypothetical protein